MTTFTAPPNEIALELISGDVLDVNQGGVATDTRVEGDGTVVVDGGDAVNTVLYSGGELVNAGEADGITFTGLGTTNVLALANPSLFQGTMTFESGSYTAEIDFEVAIDSIKQTGDTLTVTYGNNQTVTYHYSGALVFFNLDKEGDQARITAEVSPDFLQAQPEALHRAPGIVTTELQAQPEALHHAPGIVGILHHLGGEFHAYHS